MRKMNIRAVALSVATLAIWPACAFAQQTEPTDPADPEIVPPFVVTSPGGPSGPGCAAGTCTIIDFYNPNIPAEVQRCIATDQNGHDVNGHYHNGNTCVADKKPDEQQQDVEP